MGLSTVFDVAATGMNAQTVRMNTTASNLANAEAAGSSTDEVYRARHPVFATLHQQALAGMGGGEIDGNGDESTGVQVLGIVESDAPLQQRYEPHHPKADENGYVYYPNVNVMEEMTNMISASRSFQVNVETMNAAKSMMQRVLTLGQ